MTWIIAYMLIGLAITILFVSSSCFRESYEKALQDDGIEGVWDIAMAVACGMIFLVVTWPISIIWFIKGFIEASIEDK